MPADAVSSPDKLISFDGLGLSKAILDVIKDVGYESPTPIQAATIPPMLAGRDVLGQAQTGTGKTAAFALPILSRIELRPALTQALILAPTRELAIQVAEAFQHYATHLKDFHVLPIYGGQSYEPQLRGLKRGAQVVVGTPGRVVDHLKRGTLNLGALAFLVLDEADEMLRMGFIEDVEWILQQTPSGRQVALFSATLPAPVRKIAQTYLKSPTEVTIQARTSTAPNIRQSYWMVSGMQKLDALTRILETEPFDGMIVFTRTKFATEDLAERLAARGFGAAALNGDMPQQQRERTVARFRDGTLDILVATDVAARGLDVERVSHVLNFDIPTDTESYVHRVGRTGRAGRAGEAILFVTPRERHLLRAIERATRQAIEHRSPPSMEAVNTQRIVRFKQAITDALASENRAIFQSLIEEYEREQNVPAAEIAAALACIVQGDKPMLLKQGPAAHSPAARDPDVRPARPTPRKHEAARGIEPDDRQATKVSGREQEKPKRKKKPDSSAAPPMETYRIEVGSVHGVKPGNIVGAIANEGGLDAGYIGHIDIRADYSLIDLPQGMPKETQRDLQKTRVAGQALRISRVQATKTDRPVLAARRPAKVEAGHNRRPSSNDRSTRASQKSSRSAQKMRR